MRRWDSFALNSWRSWPKLILDFQNGRVTCWNTFQQQNSIWPEFIWNLAEYKGRNFCFKCVRPWASFRRVWSAKAASRSTGTRRSRRSMRWSASCPTPATCRTRVHIEPGQCDQIWWFIGLWATFKSFWQQLICPNLSHSYGIFVKESKSIIFLVKSFLGKFYRYLAAFYWSYWLGENKSIWNTLFEMFLFAWVVGQNVLQNYWWCWLIRAKQRLELYAVGTILIVPIVFLYHPNDLWLGRLGKVGDQIWQNLTTLVKFISLWQYSRD